MSIPPPIEHLQRLYSSAQLRQFPGDRSFRYRVFAPYLRNLEDGKLVYYEHFMCIARLTQVSIREHGFSATASVHLAIERPDSSAEPPRRPWLIGAGWEHLLLSVTGIYVPYVGWKIWPDADLVREVETLVRAGNHDAALKVTLYENR